MGRGFSAPLRTWAPHLSASAFMRTVTPPVVSACHFRDWNPGVHELVLSECIELSFLRKTSVCVLLKTVSSVSQNEVGSLRALGSIPAQSATQLLLQLLPLPTPAYPNLPSALLAFPTYSNVCPRGTAMTDASYDIRFSIFTAID